MRLLLGLDDSMVLYQSNRGGSALWSDIRSVNHTWLRTSLDRRACVGRCTFHTIWRGPPIHSKSICLGNMMSSASEFRNQNPFAITVHPPNMSTVEIVCTYQDRVAATTVDMALFEEFV